MTVSKLLPWIQASHKIPQSFFWCNTKSLGHLICIASPVTCFNARHMAYPASNVSCGTCSGVPSGYKSILIHTPVPLGDGQLRPSRPLPWVCSSATTIQPSSAVRLAHSFATVLVEVTCSYLLISCPILIVLIWRIFSFSPKHLYSFFFHYNIAYTKQGTQVFISLCASLLFICSIR